MVAEQDLWLSPSSAYWLLQCPARWEAHARGAGRGQLDEGFASVPPSAALGVALHKALELWFKSRDWWPADVDVLDRRFVEQMEACGASVTTGQAKQLRARLRRQAPLLAEWVHERGDPHPEVELRDVDARVSGRADLVVAAEKSFCVVDVKTGEWDSSRVEVQLALYAKCLLPSYGDLQSSGVFSPRDGLVVFDAGAERYESIWDELLAAREAVEVHGARAVASQDVCRFCPARSSCERQWEAVEQGSILDAVRGRLVGIQVSANGDWAVELECGGGNVVIGRLQGLPKDVTVGQEVAVMELSAPRESTSGRVRQANRATRVVVLHG